MRFKAPRPSRLVRASLLATCGAILLAGPGALLLGCAGRAPERAPNAAAELRRLVHSASHPDLRWREFPDFRSQLERLYARGSWRLLWIQGTHPSEAATSLIGRLAAAESLGLDSADYDASWLDRESHALSDRSRRPAVDELARFDVGLSVAAVRFVSALHRGRVSPRVVHASLFIPRPSIAIELAVDSLRDARSQGPILDHLQPRFLHYQLLKNGLARFRALARDTSLLPLPAIPGDVRPGMALSAAPSLRRLLEATGDLGHDSAPNSTSATRYTADLVAGVKRFQARQGLEPDGSIGPTTAERLNRPFVERVRQIELALERFRWLPSTFSAPPIIVNVPAFRLYAFRGASDREEDMLIMDIVVGDAFDTHTPLFAADMKYLIFRPYWEVPASIMVEELGPKALADRGFLERERMVLVRGESEDAPVLPATTENIKQIGKDVRVRQLPGPQNALGLVKFLLPNANDVYLHDTAAKGLFARTRRDFSHGCIRVSDPVALAVHLLGDQPEWTEARVRAAMDGEDNTRVDLSRPVPVCIVYATAIARQNGDMLFYPDIYDLDGELDRLLKKGYPYPN